MRTCLSNNNIALDLPSSHSTHIADNQAHHCPVVLSPRLHNIDLAPTKAKGRRWGRYSIFALWTNDVHNIANYSFAIGLYALGLGGWQILLSLGIGAALVYCFMNLSGYMGQKTGVPFPVIRRIRFGIHGAQIPALIRAVIAIVLALVPGFHSVSPFSWLIGAGIAGMLYLIIAKREPHYADVSGESIAVDNVSH